LLPLAAKLGVPAYLFFPGNLTELALMRNAVELNDGAASESTATSRTLSSFPLQ
jgi:hydroquinone glucosyltransferase